MSVEQGYMPFFLPTGRSFVMDDNEKDFTVSKLGRTVTHVSVKESSEINEREALCRRYATDTWRGLEHMSQTATGFPEDMVKIDGRSEVSNHKTSPTNIGLFLTSAIAARDLELMSTRDSEQSIDTVLTSLENAKKYKGLFYNWYDTQTGDVIDKTDNSFISTVDNAWLAAGLMTILACAPQFSERADAILNQMNLPFLYDNDRNLFYGGYYPESQKSTNWHYDILNTEARIASYVGISRFGIPSINYNRLGRYAPADRDVSPLVSKRQFASWGGSMFEALMPTLLIPEQEWSQAWKNNHRNYVDQQVQYGKRHNNGFWGFSPSNNPSGEYTESGLAELAIREGGYGTSSVITPHAMFLGLPFMPEVVQDLQRLELTYPSIYKENIGFVDSVNVQTGEVSHTYLSLDQAMSFISLSNLLSGDSIPKSLSPQLQLIKPLIESLDYDLPLAA